VRYGGLQHPFRRSTTCSRRLLQVYSWLPTCIRGSKLGLQLYRIYNHSSLIQRKTRAFGIMRFTLLSLLPAAFAFPAALSNRAERPVYWLLAGDSTTATNGGWGNAFISTTGAPGSSGANYGHSGATTKSFRAEGDWDTVIKGVGAHKDSYRVYVTIQVFSPIPSSVPRSV
jgi:hypothetical protein